MQGAEAHRFGNVSFSHILIAFAHESGHSCGFLGDDVANDAALLPASMAMADRLCTWLQCLPSQALLRKSPKARGPEVEKSDERVGFPKVANLRNILGTGEHNDSIILFLQQN